MANTERFEPEHVIEALRQAGGIRSVAAQKLNCAPTTVTNYVERYPEVAQAEMEIAEELLDLTEGKLLKLIQADSERSIHFYLRTKGKHRGYTERVEQTGANGGPIENRNQTVKGLDMSKFTTEQLEKFEELMAIAAADDGAA